MSTCALYIFIDIVVLDVVFFLFPCIVYCSSFYYVCSPVALLDSDPRPRYYERVVEICCCSIELSLPLRTHGHVPPRRDTVFHTVVALSNLIRT